MKVDIYQKFAIDLIQLQDIRVIHAIVILGASSTDIKGRRRTRKKQNLK